MHQQFRNPSRAHFALIFSAACVLAACGTQLPNEELIANPSEESLVPDRTPDDVDDGEDGLVENEDAPLIEVREEDDDDDSDEVAPDEEPAGPLFICLGDAIVETQDDLENLADCSRITGDLILDQSSISDLAPLSGLTEVGGELSIYGVSYLTSLEPLRDLSYVGGNLTISANYSLEDLNVRLLEEVHGDLTISQTHLPHLDGLAALQEAP